MHASAGAAPSGARDRRAAHGLRRRSRETSRIACARLAGRRTGSRRLAAICAPPTTIEYSWSTSGAFAPGLAVAPSSPRLLRKHRRDGARQRRARAYRASRWRTGSRAAGNRARDVAIERATRSTSSIRQERPAHPRASCSRTRCAGRTCSAGPRTATRPLRHAHLDRRSTRTRRWSPSSRRSPPAAPSSSWRSSRPPVSRARGAHRVTHTMLVPVQYQRHPRALRISARHDLSHSG
jgi:hypothetical protein